MRTFLLIGLCLIAYQAGAQNDLIRQKLKGRVKSVTQCQCPVLNGKTDTGGCMIYIFKFNTSGNQTEDNQYAGGSLYNGYGELVIKHLYKYDENDKQLQVDEYELNGKLRQVIKYKYDERGNRVERCNYKANGVVWYKSIFAYDDKNNKTECSKYDKDGDLVEHYSYAYDINGSLTMEQYIASASKKPDKKRTDEEYAQAINYVKTFTYDDSARIIGEMANVANFRKLFETTYQYENNDVNGNWLKQIRIEDKKVVSITERIIEYYQ